MCELTPYLPDWQQMPAGWEAVPRAKIEAFVQRAADALSATQAVAVGNSLAELAGRWTIYGDLSPADLLLLACSGLPLTHETADSLLSSSSWNRTAILHAAEALDDGTSLEMAGPADLSSMERLHGMIATALSGSALDSSDRARVVLFLCSRLRPRLFPPSSHLAQTNDIRALVQLYRSALNDPEVRRGLTDVRHEWSRAWHMKDLAILESAAASAAQAGGRQVSAH